jgi:uncharacterized protein (TIGR02596 family)
MRQKAFSLVELLVVLAVLAILAVMTLPAVSRSLRATRLTTDGQHMVDLLNFARQSALSRNASVEVRCYLLPDYRSDRNGTPSIYRAIQAFLIDGETATPLNRPYFFSAPVQMSTNAAESALLASTNHPANGPDQTIRLGEYGMNYRYRAIRFTPNGSANVGSSENFLTLVLGDDRPLPEGGNFFSLQILPVSGHVRTFRP